MQLSTQVLDLLNELKMITANYHYAFSGRSDPSKAKKEKNINQLLSELATVENLPGIVLDV